MRRTLATNIIVDQPTDNLNIYPRDVIDKVIKRFNTTAKKKQIKCGELNLNSIELIGPQTHIAKRLYIDDSDMIYAEIKFLDNKYSKELLKKMDKSSIIIARPIMCIPEYINIAKNESKSEPFKINKINSIVRIQVECNGYK